MTTNSSSRGCWKRTTHSLDRYVYTPAFDKQSSLSSQGFISERKWVDTLLSTILSKEPIRGPSARPVSAAASIYGASVVMPKHKSRSQSATAASRAGMGGISPKQGGVVDGVEEVACLTPEEPLELGDLEQRSDEGDAYADDTFEADADAQGEEPQTAEVGINTEQMFDNHPEVEQLLKMVEKERPVSAPAGYGQRRLTETSRSPQGTGGSNFTASWGIDAINQERKARMREGEMMKDRLQKEAMIRRKNKQTPVWDFSTSKDETLRPAYEKFLRPHSAASASNSKATKTPPAARPNSGASYASMARPQSGESYASYQSTAPGNPNEAPLNMSQLGPGPGSPGSPNSKYSKTLSGLRAPLPGSPKNAEKTAMMVLRQDTIRSRCECARLRKEEEKQRNKVLEQKRKREMKMEALKNAEHEEARRRQMMEALGNMSDDEDSETWLSELRVLEHSRSLAHSLGFQTRGLI